MIVSGRRVGLSSLGKLLEYTKEEDFDEINNIQYIYIVACNCKYNISTCLSFCPSIYYVVIGGKSLKKKKKRL